MRIGLKLALKETLFVSLAILSLLCISSILPVYSLNDTVSVNPSDEAANGTVLSSMPLINRTSVVDQSSSSSTTSTLFSDYSGVDENATGASTTSTTSSVTSTTNSIAEKSPVLSSDKYLYNAGEHVIINVSAAGASYDLWIREPSGWFLALRNGSGDVLFVYSSNVSGGYLLRVEFFFLNGSRELSSEFRIDGSGVTASIVANDSMAATTTTVPQAIVGYSLVVLDSSIRAFSGDLVYVRFRTNGSEDLLIKSAEGSSYGTDIGYEGLFCGSENRTSDTYLLIHFLKDDMSNAVVPFILLPISFLFFLRRKYFFSVFRGSENDLDHEDQVKAYDAGMRRSSVRLKGRKHSLKSINSDANRIRRRSGRDFVGLLLAYDEGIRQSRKSWRDLYSSVLMLAVILSLATLAFMGLSSSEDVESGLQVYVLDGHSYYLLPYGGSVNGSYWVAGLLHFGYNCSDESSASYLVSSPGGFVLEYRFGNLSDIGRIDVGSSTTTCTIGSFDGVVPVGGLFENVSISTGKKEYILNESVNVLVYAGNLSFDLWIKGPAGWDLLLQNYSGDVSYAYASSVPGGYDLKATFFSREGSRDFSYSFRIISVSYDEMVLNGSGLSLDRKIYAAGDPVNISVYSNVSYDLWVKEPTGWFLALQNYSGGIDYVYVSVVPGDYVVKAVFYFAGRVVERSASFSIADFSVSGQNYSLSLGKDSYLQNESVRIDVLAENISFNLWMKVPDGWFLVLQNASGSVSVGYLPVAAGNYSVRAEFYLGGGVMKMLSASFEVLPVVVPQNGSYVLEAYALQQGGITLGLPVSWSGDFLLRNAADAGNETYHEVCLPVPSDAYDLEVYKAGETLSNASCFSIDLSESVNLSVRFKTSPVELVVENYSLDLSSFLPQDATDITVFEAGSVRDRFSGLGDLSDVGFNLSVLQQEVTVVHNSSLHYENITVELSVPEENLSITDKLNDSVVQVDKREIHDEKFNITVDRLSNKTYLITPQIEMLQGVASLGELVNWTLKLGNVTVRYKTSAPDKTEEVPVILGGRWIKALEIGSNASMHYYNVSAYSDVEERAGSYIRLYWVGNGSRIDVTVDPQYNVSLLDSDGNGVIDRITWIVPQLSNQSFEIEVGITVLNVQSYPVVGGNWTVRFDTAGTADLRIRAFNGTTWTNYSESGYDLLFLLVRCGDLVLGYEWVNDSVYVGNYSCNGTGVETSKVLSSGKHNLEFRYGNVTKYAYNDATYTNLSFVSPTEDNGAYISRNWTQINISITEPMLDSFRFNWNGMNYSVYDDSLLLDFNFNNNSGIGENATKAVDVSKYGNNGTCYNGTNQYCNWTILGKYGGGLNFDGVDDYVGLGL